MPEIVSEEKTNKEKAPMLIYEIAYHVIPSLEEEQIASVAERIRGLIEHSGGVFISEEFPKKRQLAYTMITSEAGKRQRHSSAYFGWIKCELPKGALEAVQESLRADKEILRSLVVKTVREHPVAVPRRIVVPREPEIKAPDAEKSAKVSDEELDKTIEKLITE